MSKRARGGSTAGSRWAFWQLAPEEAWRGNLYVVMFAVFVSFTGFTFVMPFLPLYIKQLGITDPGDAALWSGLIFGISPLLSGLLAPVWSILAERHGRKVMLQRSLGAFVCPDRADGLRDQYLSTAGLAVGDRRLRRRCRDVGCPGLHDRPAPSGRRGGRV